MVQKARGDVRDLEIKLKQLLLTVLEALLDDASGVEVGVGGGQATVVLTVTLSGNSASEFGRIVGRSGQTAEALRRLFFVVGAKYGLRTVIEIVEPGRPYRESREGDDPRARR